MQNKFIVILAIVALMGAGCGESKQEKYQACMNKQTTRQAAVDQCVQSKLKAKGYTDGMTCVGNINSSVCQDTTRYNAEIEAYNDCQKKVTPAPSTLECLEILK